MSAVSGLLSGWKIKLILSLAFSVVWEVLMKLFAGDVFLIGAVVVLLVVDLISGLAAAYKAGDEITSAQWRRAGWKFFEYALLVITFGVIDNAFEHTPYHFITGLLSEGCLFYIAFTEIFSIAENLGRTAWLMKGIEFISKISRREPVSLPEKADEGKSPV